MTNSSIDLAAEAGVGEALEGCAGGFEAGDRVVAGIRDSGSLIDSGPEVSTGKGAELSS